MKRSSIRRVSNFKLQGQKTRFQLFLGQIQKCPVAVRYPQQVEVLHVLWKMIKASSQSLFNLCYRLKEESPLIRALNFDNKYGGFQAIGNLMTYRDYLGKCKEAYLYGDFNKFDKFKHQLEEDEKMGSGYFKITFDLKQYRLDEDSKIMIRIVDTEGREFCFPPPCCRFISRNVGIYRRYYPKPQHLSKHRLSHLLAYTIDLQTITLEECLEHIEEEIDLLEEYNTVILKNLFTNEHGLLHKFSLTPQRGDILDSIVQTLSRVGVKVVIQWNFDSGQLPEQKNPLEIQYFIQNKLEFQFNLQQQSVLTYYLGNIVQYFNLYGISGIHFTKVHRISKEKNGILMIKMINLLCERIHENSITLASSKQSIVGLTQPILQGGLGFSFTYNFHQNLCLSQKHESIYEMVNKIHSSSNCLSLNFNEIQPRDYIYLLFTFLISKKGVFTRGPIKNLKEELKKVLRLRRQQQLFHQQCCLERIDQNCMVVTRGMRVIIFNFSEETVDVKLDNLSSRHLVFSQIEQAPQLYGQVVKVQGHNCLLYETL